MKKTFIIFAILLNVLQMVLSLSALGAIGYFLYTSIWQPTTELGLPLFITALSAFIVLAYFLGWIPAADKLYRVLHGKPGNGRG